MAVRTGYPATEIAGDVLTTTNFNKLPGGLLGYATVTANQGSITTIADLTGLSVAVPVNTSRIVVIVAQIMLFSSVAGDVASLYIREGSTKLATGQDVMWIVSTGYTITARCVLSPSTATHTYKLSAELSSGTGVVTMSAASTNPASIMVFDGGLAF